MAAQASPEQISQFVKVVDNFMHKASVLRAPDTQAKVYASGDARLINDYENAVSNANKLETTIVATTGAWNAAKQAYQSVTDKTSMVIGDAIDWFRSLFGYDPAPGIGGVKPPCGCNNNSGSFFSGLGAVQLPATALAAVWITGIVAAAIAMNKIIDQIMIQIQAAQIVKSNPNISKSDALKIATGNLQAGSLINQLRMPLILLAAIAAYAYVSKDK